MNNQEIIKHLAYDVSIDVLNYKSDYVGIKTAVANGFYLIGEDVYITYHGGHTGKKIGDECKLKLHPMSDIDKEIWVGGNKIIPIDWFNNNPTDNHCEVYDHWFSHVDDNIDVRWEMAPYELTKQLLKWGFDISNLIGNNLAIDINI